MKYSLRFRSPLFAFAGAAALTLACSGEVGVEEPIDTAQEHINYQPLSNSTPGLFTFGYKWGSATAATKMTPRATSACFLATVGGSFAANADRVEIVPMMDAGVEYWYLTGNAGPVAARSATAFCALNPPVVGEGT